jgi:hypothetical protein
MLAVNTTSTASTATKIPLSLAGFFMQWLLFAKQGRVKLGMAARAEILIEKAVVTIDDSLLGR